MNILSKLEFTKGTLKWYHKKANIKVMSHKRRFSIYLQNSKNASNRGEVTTERGGAVPLSHVLCELERRARLSAADCSADSVPCISTKLDLNRLRAVRESGFILAPALVCS